MNVIRRVRKELALQLSKVMPITMRHGIAGGMRLYGNLFYNRRPADLHEEERLYSSLNLKGKTVIEIGAHIGEYTIYFGRAVGDGRVLAFEPNRLNYLFLRKNVAANRLGRVEVVNAGLSNEPGSARIVSKRFNTAKGSFRPEKQSLIQDTKEPYVEMVSPITTVDAVVEKYGLKRVDFIKIDTEGFEPYVVEGMNGTLAGHSPLVYFEIHGNTGAERAADLVRVFRVLDRHGYIVRRLSPILPRVTAETLNELASGAFLAARSFDGELISALAAWMKPGA